MWHAGSPSRWAINVDIWAGRIIGQEEATVRLLAVSERVKQFVGEDRASALAGEIELGHGIPAAPQSFSEGLRPSVAGLGGGAVLRWCLLGRSMLHLHQARQCWLGSTRACCCRRQAVVGRCGR